MAGMVDLTGLVAPWDRAGTGADAARFSEPRRVVDGGGKGKRSERPHAGDRHQPSAGPGLSHEMFDVGVDGGDRGKHCLACADRATHRGGEAGYARHHGRNIPDEARGKPARQSRSEHDRQPADSVLQHDPLPDQLLAGHDRRADRVGRKRFDVDLFEEPGPGRMREPAGIVAVGLVRGERLERLVGLPAFDTGRWARRGPAGPWQSIGAMRPVSKTTDLHAGALLNASAMPSGVEAATASPTIVPSRSRTQICVFSEKSKPAPRKRPRSDVESAQSEKEQTT